jgi:hypothetical protein
VTLAYDQDGFTFGTDVLEPPSPPRRAVGEPRLPSQIELAYAAGLIDGEGCIHITKGPQYRLYLKVSMCHEETIEHLWKMFNRGTIQNVVQRIWTDAYSWLCSPKDAIEVIRLVRPYLITRVLDADIAEEFAAIPLAPQGGRRDRGRTTPAETIEARHDCWDRMRRAKSRFNFREQV